jgi:ATP-dependent DNA helicase DinG
VETIVALDIETTGLDPVNDAILEIGAVRFKGNRVEAEFSQLINPGKPVPPFITQLTGITDQMIRTAPPLREVLPALVDFAGDLPILGHNVRFDLGFLRRYKVLKLNESIDTYELAGVLMPTASRYGLGALGAALGVPLSATHRALDDARVTRAIYLQLYETTKELPIQLLAEIVRLGEQTDWGAFYTFYEILRSRSKETVSARQVQEGNLGPLFEGYETRNLPALTPNPTLYALDLDEVSSILDHGGVFSHYFPEYEYRPQQVEMLRSVTQALSESHHLMVEAGTGTGKSMAYLIPAALWAMQNHTRVVISTNTINLQDQLINKDIPDLRNALGIDLHSVVIKGRSNYLCPRRLENIRRRGPETPDEMRVLAKVLVWLQQTQTGDRGEINLNGPAEREAWMRLSAEDEGCTTETCLKRTGGACPFYRAHQAAQSAHLIIVNHALLLADVATGNRVLPEYQYLIVDEAHHIEDATTNALSFSVSQNDVDRAARELGGPTTGAMRKLLMLVQSVLSPSDYAQFDFMVQRATDHAFNFDGLVREYFSSIEQFLFEQREGQPLGTYAQQERILPSTRTLPAWSAVEMSWDEAEKPLRSLLEILAQILQGMAEIHDVLAENEESEDTLSILSNLYRRFSEIYQNVHGMVFEPNELTIYWIEMNPNGHRLSLNAAPLHIGPMMQKYLWNEKSSVIMTSATLTAAGEFDYLRGRLYAEDADEVSLGSPFDYENSALLYVANDIPEPSDRYGHQRALENAILNISLVTGGRMLVLFTSYDQLKRTSKALEPVLAKHEIRVYEQGDGASPHSLLDSFRSDERAVLMGTRAFWEGVDVPGEALSVLVIVKLPFDVPSDPIVAARAETFEDSFNQYSLPEAILRFRQGFGRLIRTQTDRGVVVVLDRRILTKRYGKLFLDSLPACTMRIGALSDLPRATKKWLNL